MTDYRGPVEAQLPDTPRSRAPYAVAISMIILSSIAVILRVAGRRIKKAKFGADDYTIVAALVCVYVMCISVILEVLYGGAGRHVQDIDPRRIENLFKILVVLQIFFGLSNGLVKCSVCLFYVRIFDTRVFRFVAWIVMAFCAAWGLMVVLTGFLLCTPLAFNWDQSIKGHCANQKTAFVSVGALDILTDLVILSLPQKLVWGLQMRTRNKIAVTGIFGLGFFTIVISCLRIDTLLKLDFQDITYSNSYPFLWSCLEPAIGVTAACAPVAKPVFGKLLESSHLPSLRKSSGSGSGGQNHARSWERVGGGKIKHGDESHSLTELSASEHKVAFHTASATSIEDAWPPNHAGSERELWMPLPK